MSVYERGAVACTLVESDALSLSLSPPFSAKFKSIQELVSLEDSELVNVTETSSQRQQMSRGEKNDQISSGASEPASLAAINGRAEQSPT